MKIRKARLSDLRECTKIHKISDDIVINKKKAELLILKYNRKAIKNDDCAFLVAEDNNKLAGYITFIRDKWNNSIHIDQLFVRFDMQGMGIGSKLLQAALKKAENMGYRIAFLETRKRNNEKTLKFYMKNGFRKAGYINGLYNEGRNSDAFVLSRKLKIK